MAEQPKHDVAIDEIKALEERRYRAMIAGDAAVLDELCSDDLIYTHSKGDHDDKRSYLHKVGSCYFTYLEITHHCQGGPLCPRRTRISEQQQQDAEQQQVGSNKTARRCGIC